MKRDEVIARFCHLSSKVGNHFKHDFANDCFCDQRIRGNDSFFLFEEQIMEFIESAVNEKLAVGIIFSQLEKREENDSNNQT